MRYIKAYESVGIGYETSNVMDFTHMINDALEFNANELNTIKALDIPVRPATLYGVYEIIHSVLTRVINGETINLPYLTMHVPDSRSNKNVSMFKVMDEWYYLEICNYMGNNIVYYKCDQMHGLLQCLRYHM